MPLKSWRSTIGFAGLTGILGAVVLGVGLNVLPAWAEASEDFDFLRWWKEDEATFAFRLIKEDSPMSKTAAIAQEAAAEKNIAIKNTNEIKTATTANPVVTVRSGDTVWSIARSCNVPVSSVIKLNNLSKDGKIRPGQHLKLPQNSVMQLAMKTEEQQSPRVEGVSFQLPLTSQIALLSSLTWPLEGALTSYFGPRKGGFHHGLDIAGQRGEPIRAAQQGTVAFAGWKPVYGKTVIIDHDYGLQTLYAHASQFNVRPGQKVQAGEAVALVGNTGVTTGPHLHFELHRDNKPVNPLTFLRRLGI